MSDPIASSLKVLALLGYFSNNKKLTRTEEEIKKVTTEFLCNLNNLHCYRLRLDNKKELMVTCGEGSIVSMDFSI